MKTSNVCCNPRKWILWLELNEHLPVPHLEYKAASDINTLKMGTFYIKGLLKFHHLSIQAFFKRFFSKMIFVNVS